MDLTKHIDTIAEAYDAAYSKLDSWRREKENATEEFRKREQKLTQEAAVEEKIKLEEEFTQKCNVIKTELSEAVASAESSFRQEVEAFYAANGKDIDSDDKAIIDSGIMTSDEIVKMVVKHCENVTMLRIISKYVTDSKIKVDAKIEHTLVSAKSDGKHELRIAETLKNELNQAVSLATNMGHSRELFLNTALRKEEYVKKAKNELLKAKLYIDEDTQNAIEQYEAEKIENRNKKYDPHNKDYNWLN